MGDDHVTMTKAEFGYALLRCRNDAIEECALVALGLTPELPMHPNWDRSPWVGRDIVATIRALKENPNG